MLKQAIFNHHMFIEHTKIETKMLYTSQGQAEEKVKIEGAAKVAEASGLISGLHSGNRIGIRSGITGNAITLKLVSQPGKHQKSLLTIVLIHSAASIMRRRLSEYRASIKLHPHWMRIST